MIDPTFDPFAGPAIVATAPSTEPQREIWTAALLGVEASLAYNESVSLRMRGPLDQQALRSSLSDLVSRHESLRGTFGRDGTTLCILDVNHVDLKLVDLSELAASEREGRLTSHFAEIVEEPFDLEHGPLFRTTLFKLGTDDHLLTFTAHHIVFDGFSTGIFIIEWGQLYTARKTGVPCDLKPAEPFTEYARREKQAAETNERSEHERYWLDQFPGEVPVLELPYDRPRPPLKTYASQRLDVALPPDLVRDIKKLGAKQGASLFVTLLSGFGMLLSRLSGQQDIVIGIPAAGQSVGEHDTLVGHCVNMLPFRGNYEPTQPLSNLLGVARKCMLNAYDHQEYTFGSLLKKLPITRDPSRLPLVSVVFNMDRALTPDALRFDGLEVEVSTNARHFENFDIFVNAVDLRDRVVLECQYNTDLFDEQTIRRWFESYEQLLRSMSEGPSTLIGDLNPLSVTEQELLKGWNNTLAERVSAECVHHLIEAQVDKTPDAIAVEFEQQTITYRELDRRANQLAHHLRELSVRRDVLVGICLERSIEMFIGLLAVHKAGGAYVPLDPGYPRDRLSYMVEDSAMPVLITDRKLSEELALSAAHIIRIDEQFTSSPTQEVTRLTASDASANASSLAYVIYTSGSTGKPKGVLIEHRSVVNLIGSLHVTPGLSNQDVVLAITTLSFDIAVSEVLLPLATGAKIVLASRDTASDGTRLLKTIEDSGVTFIDATPATYRLLLAAGWQGSPSVRVICTGEAMPRDLALELVPRVKQVWNGYGPTETTVWSTFYEVRSPVGRILIGRPVDNTQIHILDGRGHMVPLGATGEIFIGGSGLARGYLNRPDLTIERFVADPFSSFPGARMYKTGDLGRYLIDGNIECLGRNDNQVKLRGFRIELGEIENALVTHSDVVGAAVIVREDRPGDRRLCAYYVASAEIAESKLRAHLKSTLPDYMVPQHFVPLDKMPLTPSGKIDRKALPAPSGDSRGTDDFVEPNTPSERLVAELWKQALVVARVSATDDFFALGGHSLLASQILARLRVEHGIVIPFRKMFEAPTIAAFAKLVEACDKDGTPNPSPSIPRISDRGSAPLSLNQERIWILEEMDPQKWSPHLLPAAWRLKGALDVGYLKAAMQLLVERHELLRTSFHLVDGKPSQRVTDSLVFDLVERDLSKLSAAERDRELEMLFDADAEIPYDLSRAPLMRSILIKMAEEDYVLYSSRHNIIWDGWSFDLYLRDLSTAYAAIRTGSKPDLPALQISYADFAAWHREWLRGPEQAKQFVYWQKQLDGEFAPLALPTDRTRPAVRNHAGANAWVHVSTADAERLTAIGHDKGATLYTVLLSAFATLLYRYTGQRHLLIGTPVRARTRPETEDVVGPFVNTLALRFQVDPNLSFLELLAQARDTTLDAFSNQESPLEALGAKAPAVRVSFSLQDARTRPPDFGDLKIAQQHIMHRSSVNDLTLWTMYSAKDLLTVLNYSTELFNGSTIERFLDAYQSLLASILQNPMEKLDNLNVISKETRQFAEQAGRGNSRQTLPETIGQSLSIHAKADESRIAIKYGQQTLTYGEFRHELGATVSMLQSNGVGSSSCIALLGARSIAGCVAVVAAMELGAKCVAIDGDNPPSVVQELLRRETVDTVLTDTQFRERHAKALASIDSARIFAIESSKGAGGDRADLPAYRSLDQLESAKILCGAGGHNDNLFLGSTYAEILAAVAELNTTLKSSSADTVLSLDKFGTVSWVLEASFTLSAGATLIMPAVPETGTRVTDVAWVEANRPTVVFGPSELLYTLCEDSKWQAPVARIVCVGLPARGKILEIMLKRSSEVWNVFSFMEGAVWNTVQQFSESTDRFQIGRALGNSQIEVIDDKGRMCPPGVPGRVRITRGNGDSVITTERARLLGNGSFEYNGPGRDIAWILGQRVNLRAIEEALSSHPSMRESAVTALERAPGEPALVAYFVPQADSAFTETELRKYLRQNLPEFMVPQEFMELSSMPRNAEGVVALTKLPSPFASNDRILLPPRTEAELLVAEIWQRALELERVSLDDNFFNIGGHSLLCFQVIDDIQRRTGIRLSPRTMLLDTLEQVAAGLGAPKPQAAAPIPGPATPDTSFGSKLLGKLRKLSGN